MTADEVLGALRARQDALAALGVDRMYLFGSTARGEARPDSDVDLFFDPATRMSLFDVMAVRDEAADALGVATDVATRSSLHPYLKARIEAEAIRVI